MNDKDDFFRKLFDDVTPIKNPKPLIKARSKGTVVARTNKKHHAFKKEQLKQAQERAQEFRTSRDHSLDAQEPDDFLSASSELSFRRAGVQLRTFNKLKNAKLKVDAKIDFHGYRVKQAQQSLPSFIEEAQANGCRCLLIIHGKGQRNEQHQAILKTHVANWLTQIDEVLAYHSALQKDGGLGAVYVLLRKKR